MPTPKTTRIDLTKRESELQKQLEILSAQLHEARETLRAIQQGEVDALVVDGPAGDRRIFTLQGADHVYRTLVERMGEGAVTVTPEGMVLFANQRFAELAGAPIEEIISAPISRFLRAGAPGALEAMIRQEGRGAATLIAAGGGEVPVCISAATVHSNGVRVMCLVVTDLTERRRAEMIQSSLRERETLLKEIHHRVKNNLQIVSSLLSLQSTGLRDAAVQGIFKDSQTRIRSMALIHEQLYQSPDFASVNMQGYLEQLFANLYRSNGSPSQISWHVNASGILLAIDSAIPCALILNELVSNSFEHAFTPDHPGAIRVMLERVGTDYCLTVQDDGRGLPEHVSLDNPDTLGLRLIQTLTEQLNGRVDVRRHEGTTFLIHFSDIPRKART